MYNNKLVSIFLCTRKRVIFLKNLIKSVLDTVNNISEVEMTFIIDDDDEDTKSIIKSLPFDNLYINGEKMDYEKNTEYDKHVDMHFIIGDRQRGYPDMHLRYNNAFKLYPVGKWTFILNDDVEIKTKNWTENLKRIDSSDKLSVAKLNDWNFPLVQSEIPKLFEMVCPNAWLDLWYDEISKELDLYVESDIVIEHTRTMNGSTSEDREKFFRQLERSPNWINNTWHGGPPSYDTKIKNEWIKKIKKYIKSKDMNIKNEFSEKLVNFFDSIHEINEFTLQKDFVKEIPDTIICNFLNGPSVEIIGKSDSEYTIEFIDNDTDEVIHRTIITPQHWTRANRQWFTNWKIKIYTTELVYEHVFNATDKKVYIHLSSESIGDTLAWFPYVEEYRKKHKCRIVCSTFHNYFFESKYPNIEFVSPGTQVHNLYAMYEIGIYDGDLDRNKNDHKEVPLQKVASDMLGFEFKEIRPNIAITHVSNEINGKYVIVSTESSAQCKFWNYKGGWQEIVDYLISLGYKVVLLQKSKSDLRNIIDKTGRTLQDAINIISGAEFVVGISSGISWLSWALKKKTILISGFTKPWYEFNENCYRVFNKHSCNGCWHKHTFDKGDWNWCPMKKNFECSTTITPEQVKVQINTLVNKYDYFYTIESPDEKINLTNEIIQLRYHVRDFNSSACMFHEIFRELTYNFNECKINPGDVVLDIGANMGVFTRYAIANGAHEVYSFEPITENYDLLKKNSKEFSIIPFNSAISNKNGTEIFHIDSTSGGHTILDKDPNNSRTDETREIDCYTIDYLFKDNWIPDKIDFLKIDVEGAEIKVLEGISDENLGKINKIAIEWHKFLFDDKDLLDRVIDRLYSQKFQFYIDYNSSDLDTIYFWK